MTPDPITIIVQLAFGFAIKRFPALAKWPSKLIPIFNYVLAVLIGIGQGVANAGFGDFISGGFGKLLLEAALNTLISTGTHSTLKNAKQQIK